MSVRAVSVLILLLFSQGQSISRGTVRLFRNGVGDTTQSWSSGIVQFYNRRGLDGLVWGNICDDLLFGLDEADVLCHQLGYTGASSFTNTGNTSIFGTDYSATLLEDVSCLTSSFLAITQCSFSVVNDHTFCTDSDDVVLTCNTARIWDSPTTGDIRLTGGVYSNQGRLEIYCNGEWGSVCDEYFGFSQARVACRQLGYDDYKDYDHLPLAEVDNLPSIWLHSFTSCSASDTCLTECGDCPSTSVTTCGHDHYKDVTLECEYFSGGVFSNTDDVCSTDEEDGGTIQAILGAVRFVRNGVADTTQSWSSGIVQIDYSGEWVNICNDFSFGAREADVLCHQLGYTDALSFSNTRTTKRYGTDDAISLLSDVSCATSAYLTISQCSFNRHNNSCTDDDDVIVACETTRIWNLYLSAGDIRLTGGMYSNQGRLEIFCNGEWGTVCGEFFSSTEAAVACRQLGYNDYTNYGHLPLLGANNSSSIWLRSFSDCSLGMCLTDCGGCPSTSVTICTHNQDVTLECEYNRFISTRVFRVIDDTCISDKGSSNIASILALVFTCIAVPCILLGWVSCCFAYIRNLIKKFEKARARRQLQQQQPLSSSSESSMPGAQSSLDTSPLSTKKKLATFSSTSANDTLKEKIPAHEQIFQNHQFKGQELTPLEQQQELQEPAPPPYSSLHLYPSTKL